MEVSVIEILSNKDTVKSSLEYEEHQRIIRFLRFIIFTKYLLFIGTHPSPLSFSVHVLLSPCLITVMFTQTHYHQASCFNPLWLCSFASAASLVPYGRMTEWKGVEEGSVGCLRRAKQTTRQTDSAATHSTDKRIWQAYCCWSCHNSWVS